MTRRKRKQPRALWVVCDAMGNVGGVSKSHRTATVYLDRPDAKAATAGNVWFTRVVRYVPARAQ